MSYDAEFFRASDAGAAQAAAIVVPAVADIFVPQSVVDVGCGSGAFLQAFRRAGAVELLGLDSGAGTALRRIAPHEFVAADLEVALPLERRYDLAVSLEVAEHLSRARAPGFVADLTRAAPVVLFSAAIPYQGGIHHVNEQWPSYWREQFAQHNFECFDVMRPLLWHRDDIGVPYAQNTLLFASPDAACIPRLHAKRQWHEIDQVHPRAWVDAHEQPKLRALLGAIPAATRRAVEYRVAVRRRRLAN